MTTVVGSAGVSTTLTPIKMPVERLASIALETPVTTACACAAEEVAMVATTVMDAPDNVSEMSLGCTPAVVARLAL